MTTANVYQQRPTTDVKAESPLFHANLDSLIGKGAPARGFPARENWAI